MVTLANPPGHLVKRTRWLMISLAFWATVINYLEVIYPSRRMPHARLAP